MRHQLLKTGVAILFFFIITGCSMNGTSNGGQMLMYPIPDRDAEEIRNGEPIEFDGKQWYPQDGIENLLDSEVYLLGEYRGGEFFVEKTDVKPYDRLYTKFGQNRFRYFKAKEEDDQ